MPNETSFLYVGNGVILIAWVTNPNSSLALVTAPSNLKYNMSYCVTGFFRGYLLPHVFPIFIFLSSLPLYVGGLTYMFAKCSLPGINFVYQSPYNY